MSRFTPSDGYKTIEQEFEDRLRKAFAPPNKADYIFIDSRRDAFQFAGASFGHAQGWLTAGEYVEIDEQYGQIRFRLTDAGKARFGIN